MWEKKLLLVAVAAGSVLLTGCTPPTIGDTAPAPLLETEVMPTKAELKAQMSGQGTKIILSPVEYSDNHAKGFTSEVYEDLSQRLLKSGNTLVDRTLAAKLKNELLAAESSGKYRTSGPAVADIAIMTKISEVGLTSRFSESRSWVDDDGEKHKIEASCRFESTAELYVRAYKIPSMELINTYEYEGSSSSSTETRNSKCPISDVAAATLVSRALQDAVKSGSFETLNDLAPDAYVIERRDNEDSSKALFQVTISKRAGAVEGATVKFYRKSIDVTPITNEERVRKTLLGEGEIIAEGINDQTSYVYVKDKELIETLQMGDIAQLEHGKCDADETQVFGSCVKIPSI